MQQTRTETRKGGSFLLDESGTDDIFTPEDFSDQQKMIAQTTGEFVDSEVVPRAAEIDEQREGVTVSLLKKAGGLGLLSVDVPEEYGGLGLDKTSSALVTEQVGRTGSWAVSFGAHTGIGTLPIVYFGNDHQKQKYLPKLATGELISSYSLSEPGSGSDALSARTTATLVADGALYRLNGTKMWLSNAGFADLYITFAKIESDRFSAFIIEKGFPGVSTGIEEKKMGIKGSSTRQLILENADVPVENLLGEIGRGHIIAFNILNIGRFKLGAGVIGAAKDVISRSIAYARTRHQFNQPIAQFGLIKHKLAEMAIRTYAGESMVYRTSGMIDDILESIDRTATDAPRRALKGIEEYAVECSVLKVYCSEILDYVVDEAVQIFGGYGYSEDYPVARSYRDSRINRIFEGTNEINRMLIPGMILKRSMKGELGVLTEAQRIAQEFLNPSASDGVSGSVFGAEHSALTNARKLAVLLCGAAVQRYLDTVQDQQEVLSGISDIVMEVYAMESLLLRVEKRIARAQGDDVHTAVVRIFVNDAMQRVEMQARNILASIFEGDTLRTYLTVLRRLMKSAVVNTVPLRRSVADSLIETGKYSL